jgi:hypothetical protein
MPLRSTTDGCLLTTEREQLLRQGFGPFPRLSDFLEVAEQLRLIVCRLGDERRIAENRGEQVVEVVGHAAGELADGFHLL